MIYCPFCKEEIEERSYYCDQCGKALSYCKSCGHVGTGRRCTLCGGIMLSGQELDAQGQRTTVADGFTTTQAPSITTTSRSSVEMVSQSLVDPNVPRLTLVSNQMNISIQGINGAIIGRRQGPYRKLFEKDMYVSGVHAQLFYSQDNGWCIMDKHSSNGTFLNRKRLQADMGMPLKNSDILSIANIHLQVIID